MTNTRKIRVLVVEDSPVLRELLIHILSADAAIEVVATAADGNEALDAIRRVNPDVVTMDIHMEGMDGFEASRQIMETMPRPIVVVSGSRSRLDRELTFRAIEAGALTVVEKPNGIGHPNHAKAAAELIKTVKLMSEVKVIRRWPRAPLAAPACGQRAPVTGEKPAAGKVKIVAIGASAGGPLVLQAILQGLARPFPAPIAIVQHIVAGFTQGLVEWLDQTTGFPVHLGRHGESLLAGHAYVAPDGVHMGVSKESRILLHRGAPENGHCPSVSNLFRSVANVCGANAIGVLLSGMGNDGARELGLISNKGGITIAQNRESAIVPGMPGEAIRLGTAMHVLTPERIVQALTEWVVDDSGLHTKDKEAE